MAISPIQLGGGIAMKNADLMDAKYVNVVESGHGSDRSEAVQMTIRAQLGGSLAC
jgi:hypothetical protein